MAAIVGVDLSTEWIGDLLNARHIFPSSYNILLSGEDRLICGPNGTIKSKDVEQIMGLINDSTANHTVSTSGRIKVFSFVDWEDRSKGSVYYYSPKSITPWSIAVVNYDDEVFESLMKMRWRNLLLTLAALLILAFIIQRSAGITLKRVESEEFQQALNRLMDNPDLITLLRPLMAYNLGGNRKVRSIESTNDYTTQVLYRMGFQWPPTAADYVHRFVDTIVGFDYFTV